MEGLFLALLLLPVVSAIAVYLADRKAESSSGGLKTLRDILAGGAGILEFILMCILAYSGMGSSFFVPEFCGDRKSVV